MINTGLGTSFKTSLKYLSIVFLLLGILILIKSAPSSAYFSLSFKVPEIEGLSTPAIKIFLFLRVFETTLKISIFSSGLKSVSSPFSVPITKPDKSVFIHFNELDSMAFKSTLSSLVKGVGIGATSIGWFCISIIKISL